MARDIFIVHGSDPEQSRSTEPRPLAAFLEAVDADSYLLNGLMGIVMGHSASLEVGGQLSLLVTRGRRITVEEPEPPMTVASFTVNGPTGKDRHVWDFHVERAQIAPMGVKLS